MGSKDRSEREEHQHSFFFKNLGSLASRTSHVLSIHMLNFAILNAWIVYGRLAKEPISRPKFSDRSLYGNHIIASAV